MQNKRMFIHDYTYPGFYMITILSASRRRLFGTCLENSVHLSSIGQTIRKRWDEIPAHRSAIETSDLVIMPDHIHGILYVKEQLAKPIGETIRGFKSGVTSELRKTMDDSRLLIWEEGYHDRIIMNSDTLCEERRYIADNPRRYCQRKDNPDLFIQVTGLENPKLPNGLNWSGFGNMHLLEKSDLMSVQVSRSATDNYITTLKTVVLDRVLRGTVMVSPFISQGEKDIASLVINNDYGSLILLKPDAFPPLYKPSRVYFDLCAQGRLLVLSPFSYTGRREKLTRNTCLQMNNWVRKICGNNAATQ